MDIQIISDLHLEQCNEYLKIEPQCEYLFLAGDIGKINNEVYGNFLRYCNDNWKLVFYVLGNHEFYHNKKTYEQLYDEYDKYINSFNNIVLLNKKEYMLNGYKILGCTLWSNTHITSNLNDFKHIKEKRNGRKYPISLDTFHKMHEIDKKWLLENYNEDEKTIILTHFPTCRDYIVNPICCHNIYSTYFTNEIHFNNMNSLICISGHTHFSYDIVENNVRYISNQYGYQDEQSNVNLRCLFNI